MTLYAAEASGMWASLSEQMPVLIMLEGQGPVHAFLVEGKFTLPDGDAVPGSKVLVWARDEDHNVEPGEAAEEHNRKLDAAVREFTRHYCEKMVGDN